jgi:hypothetical protein
MEIYKMEHMGPVNSTNGAENGAKVGSATGICQSISRLLH